MANLMDNPSPSAAPVGDDDWRVIETPQGLYRWKHLVNAVAARGSIGCRRWTSNRILSRNSHSEGPESWIASVTVA
ncbi:MAG: hypothetical protein COZ06_30355 [Armatimonadetes bacterium CG_4_10_14_3_um_filter_66_18]|nr:MAG: hypothetical protein AUJ96_09300 [Armatimonadetes bacterium CG2_30_66_41]PIU92914.1 MAG: hypothetical protein COS65_15485 [Armatimonadetes bacterium CG06_land_8_20_14_3_00_66_21]PIX39119.1 MAG: hypothetical protein COZ57_28875 [Armatimonadetes bacterium CG_4_8_14_3_um_filter_66_20]PIY39024.1 MAG: hypothetical protein COZ06_30355 [Armatimonadetes bacterium CG_4_10_14_3_um_filter_66_18]PIZ34246.1 MAG: hypothetical protein COY42_28985 [Armatimonadetes bacterium CG_4_10_14_0_8_um_filter_66_